jgi:uncharacterized radical SAM superfamily Fe-S cluster-containing enzyme
MRTHPSLPDYLERWNRHHPRVLEEACERPVSPDAAETELEQFKVSLRRYDPRKRGLPWPCQSWCHPCDQAVPARFERRGPDVVLVRQCGVHGVTQEAHEDVIFTERPSDRVGSAEWTFGGVKVKPVVRGLPRTVETLCPECGCVILGRYYEHDGAVWIEKTCPEHGYFQDIVNRDVRCYRKAAPWSWDEGFGQMHPRVGGSTRCPTDCGLCAAHQGTSILAQIDLTTRCNLHCPVCFANSNASGRVLQPELDQVVRMMQQLRDLRPIPASSVQFSGGEPTLHPQFHEIIRRANQMGFTHVQIATNGITHANEAFAARSAEAGLHTMYLQFDGVGEEWYRKTRGQPVWEKKLACLENCRRYGIKICLVPTIVRGVNDGQVGPILWFAIKNIDVISGISYQPVCFTGRISHAQRLQQRYTLGDMAHDIAAALPGGDPVRDFFPMSLTQPFSKMLACWDGLPKIETNCHTDCTYGTYLLVSPEGRPYTFPQVLNISELFWDMDRLARKIIDKGHAGRMSFWDKLQVYLMFRRHFYKHNMPPGLTIGRFINTLLGCVDKNRGRGEGEQRTYRTLLAAGMHFQDRYNFDVERVKRCVILYATPDGIYPFCTYNGGPAYRGFIERVHGQTCEEFRARHADQPLQASSHPNAVMPWVGRLGQEVDEPVFSPELERRIEQLVATYNDPSWADGNGHEANGRTSP